MNRLMCKTHRSHIIREGAIRLMYSDKHDETYIDLTGMKCSEAGNDEQECNIYVYT